MTLQNCNKLHYIYIYNSIYGSLLQVNAEYNEIIVSAATVDNVQIITAITAAQLNQVVAA